MTKTIEITDKDYATLWKVWQVITKKKLIKNFNFINIESGEKTNASFEYENFMFEKFGVFFEENHLSPENKALIAKAKEKAK